MTSFRRSEPVTPDDSVNLAEIAEALHIGGAGNLNVHVCGDPAGVNRLFKGLAAGSRLEMAVDRVLATTTTATDLLALRSGTPRNVAALAMTYAPVTTATKDSPYTGATPAVSGGLRPYAFTLQAGTLPTGTSLSATTGVISGTPTVTQTKTGLVIRATDANGAQVDTDAFQIAVA